MLTLKQFTGLAESYGSELQRWPADMRLGAEALLADSTPARRLLAEAEALDVALREASAREDLSVWPPGASEAALARLRNGVGARLESSPGHPPAKGSIAWARPQRARAMASISFGWAGMAVSGGLAVAAGLLIGAMTVVPPASGDVLAMLQPAPMPILAE